jgi:hypothetical protein
MLQNCHAVGGIVPQQILFDATGGNMNRFYRFGFASLTLALAILLLPAAGNNAFAQVLKGSISGTVTDPQGAVVSGAQVRATQADTGAVFTTTSDSSGLFRLNLLPVGTYKVEITAQGFKTLMQPGIAVNAGVDAGLGSVKLEVGQITETIEVSAGAPLVDTTQAQVTNTFSKETLQTFAGIQENQGLDNLALFVPGAANTRDQTFSNSNGPGFSSNGLRGRNNDQELDGQNNNDNSVGGPGLFATNPEFVAQYEIVTNQFNAEYGRNAGSVVNIITKSGSNNWHGSIYGNENNSKLNTMTNFEKNFITDLSGNHLTKQPRLNNEFGGFTVGGPWVKDKVFFFGGFDEQLISTASFIHSDALTPTPAGLAQLNGCFATSQSLQAFDKFGPFANSNGTPTPAVAPSFAPNPGQFTPIDVRSGTLPVCAGVQFGGVTRTLSQPLHQFDMFWKNDLQLSHDTISGRYYLQRLNVFNNDFGDAITGYPVNVPALTQTFLLSWTHNISTHMTNEARGSFGRLNVDFGGNTIGNTVPTANRLDQGLAQGTIQAVGFMNLFGAANNLPQQRIVNTWQGQDNWNYIAGKHQIKAGVNFTYQRTPNIFLPNINGTFRFPNWSDVPVPTSVNPSSVGCPSTSNASCVHGFISNQPNRVRIAQGPSSLDFREHDTFLYGQDDWKITQHLTLNVGLTWTYYGQPENLFHTITTKQQTGPNPFWNPALPLSVTTFPTIPTINNSFGPSIGFAYSPQWGGFFTGRGKTVFRGGFRLAYDPPYYNIYINESTAAPEVFRQTFSGGAARSKPLPLVPTGPNVRASLAPFLTNGVFDPRTFDQTNVKPDFGPDKVQSWSLGFERPTSKNSAVEIRYVGNHAFSQFQTVNGNPLISQLKADFPSLVPAGLTPCAATQQVGPGAGTDIGRVNCGTGNLRTRSNGGFSNYHALQAEFRASNLFNQLLVKAAYTYSKTLDNVSEIFATAGAGNTNAISQNPLNFNGPEYSFSGLHFPQTFTITFAEQLPFFKQQRGAIGHLLGGWAISANYIQQSGQRYTPVQFFSATFSNPGSTFSPNSPGDYYDLRFWGAFFGFEPARPFIGSLSAPATSAGMFAGDACNLFSLTGNDPLCNGNPNQLISLSAVGASGCETAETATTFLCPFVPVTKDQVRFIANSFQAQQLFGTPFGNAPRNIVTDAPTSIGNFSVVKRIKFNERSGFEFRTTFLNAFNHPNFASVDPFLEDAGLTQQGTGFGNLALQNTVRRQILFGGVFRF